MKIFAILGRRLVIIGVLAIAIILFSRAPLTQAHELKTGESISALLHINPDDDPRANQPSELLFLINDKEKKFNIENCDCTATVVNNGQTIFTSELFKGKTSYKGIFAPAIPYTFPHKGVYTIILSGKPKDQHDFQSFSIFYDVRVEKDANNPPPQPQRSILYYAIIIGIFIATGYFLKLFFTNKNNILKN